jgi:hypothetical protein
MNIVKATHRFETWLGGHTTLVKPDLSLKHQRMAEAVFPFLRATFYRWMQIWPEICPDLAKAPRVLAVGDLHVENFGTWRDIEGRLVWGVNDFDEAAVLPYTIDLVRLAASALFAIVHDHPGRIPRVPRQTRSPFCARRGSRLAAPDRHWSIARSGAFLAKDGSFTHYKKQNPRQLAGSPRTPHAGARSHLSHSPARCWFGKSRAHSPSRNCAVPRR